MRYANKTNLCSEIRHFYHLSNYKYVYKGFKYIFKLKTRLMPLYNVINNGLDT